MGGRPPSEGGAFGPIQLSRACGPYPGLPASQGYIGTGGVQFMPAPRQVFSIPGAALGDQTMPPGYGAQWAPGKGGDTPGGGGGYPGNPQAVSTLWINDGMVTPVALQHRPGTVGFQGSRRSGA